VEETNRRSAILSNPLLVIRRQQQVEIGVLRQIVEREQVADRVLVLGARKAMEERQSAGVRVRGGHTIERAFEL
jgi:hypothetical protein